MNLHKLKSIIKKSPAGSIVFWIRRVGHRSITEGNTKCNILRTFPQYEANGWGKYKIRAKLTIDSINSIFPALNELCPDSNDNLFQSQMLDYMRSAKDSSQQLGTLFNKYGSDKASTHNYHELYEAFLSPRDRIRKIFEIGLGTNNLNIVSTMGKGGRPGASLRAFRDYCTNAEIFGADFDASILFNEDRIRTFFVDQTKASTFAGLGPLIGDNFDLMIDDGLHSPHANLNSLIFFLPLLRVGGVAVIEDVSLSAEPIWRVVAALLPKGYSSAFIQTKVCCVFIVKRDY
jgi:hypothetical protein